MKSFSINEALSVGWEAFKGRVGFFIGLLLLFGVFTAIPQIIVQSVETAWLAVVLAIVAQLFQYFLAVGLIKISLAIVDGGQPEISDLFSGGPLFVPYVLGSLLYGIAVAVGFLLLVVPGVIVSVIFAFYGYAVVDKGLGPVEALKASAAITKEVRWKLFGFMLVIGLLNMAGALLVGLGLFVTVPMSFVALAFVYRQLSLQTQSGFA